MSNVRILLLLVFADVILLFYGVSTLSISYPEAVIFFDDKNFLHYIVKFSTSIFGQNDYALRIPFILFHIGSIFLLYHVSGYFLKRDFDRLLAVITFMLLPGVVGAALLVNSASVAIFFTLLFILLFLQKRRLLYMILLPFFILIDNSFMILYLGVFSYGVYVKDKVLASYSALLFLLALGIYGFHMGGKPKGYILDTLSAYSIIFSPLIFLYFFYTLYRILMKEEKNIVWFISFVALIFSILISYRQRILIDDFAPYVVVSVPLMVKMFMGSYRVRLPELRRGHKILFVIVFLMLFANFTATYAYKYFYLFIANPTKHFAYKYNIAKELAFKLKKLGINKVQTSKKLQKRLRFYSIARGKEYILSDKASSLTPQKVTISYMKKPIKTYYVSKVNK